MNVFIILAILIIVIGVFIMTASSSEIFKFNWNEKTGLKKILMIIFLQRFALFNKYHLLVYQMKKMVP